MRAVIAVLFFAAASTAHAGEIFKCKNADGSTSFSDRPCAASATSLSVPRGAEKDAPVSWLCDNESARQDPVPDVGLLAEKQRNALAAAAKAAGTAGSLKSFTERGNIHLCERAADRGPVLAETVVMPDGVTWQRKGGKSMRIGGNEENTAGTECTSRITACLRPGGSAMEKCVDAIPACTASITAGCCPADCLSNYHTSREQGLPLADGVERMLALPVCTGAR